MKSEWREVSVCGCGGVRSERDMGGLLDLEFLRFLRSCRKYSNELSAADDGREVCVAGWLHDKRDLGGVLFALIRDRGGVTQVTLRKETVGEEMLERFRKISRESVVAVIGVVKAEKRAPRGFEIVPKRVEVLSEAKPELPLDVTGRVPANLDTRLDARFMDLRSERVKQIFLLRARVLKLAREFLDARGFVEINTPKIVSTATEGGAALFPISYFEREAFLNQSPQLYKQMMMASGFDAVYEIGPIFRAEEHDTTKHLNEATSLDVEVAFADHEYVMSLLEDLVVHIYEGVAEYEGLKALNISLEVPKKPFERITYEKALELLAEEGVEIEWGEDLSTLAEKTLGELIGAHYFITDWPCEIKPYYAMPAAAVASESEHRTNKDNERDDRGNGGDGGNGGNGGGNGSDLGRETCNAFDLMHPRLELASGSQRIHDYELLRKNIAARGLNPESFRFYLEAFKYGMPPHAGFGLGIERLLMTMLNIENIREVILFPRDRRRLVP